MGGGSDVMKLVLALLFLVNVGALCWNGYQTIDRALADDPIEASIDGVKTIKKKILSYRNDMDRIRRQNIIEVENETTYFRDQAKQVWPNPDQMLTFTGRASPRTVRNFKIMTWKIMCGTAANRETVFNIKDLARYCQLLEAGSPQFQIAEVDAGERSAIWGKNEWKAKFVSVRRITRATK